MLVQVLDTDYIMVDGKPVIRIFGKKETGENVCVFYEGFLPYFYVTGKNAEKILKNEGLEFSKVKKNIIMRQEPEEVFKIILADPSKIPEVREKLRQYGLKAYEADILFRYRFMSDHWINGMGWIEVNGNAISTNSVTSPSVKATEIKPVERAEDAELKILVFDIECVTNRNTDEPPTPKKDPIVLISIIFSHPYNGKKEIVIGTRSGSGVSYFPDEKAMLEEMVKIFTVYDPDIISGYNINGFDFPYLIERLKQNGIKQILGRCSQKNAFTTKFGTRSKVYITGRVVADIYDLVKKDFSLKRYDLDTVSMELLGERKHTVKHSEIKKLWLGDQESFERLVEYVLQDARLAMKLLNMNLLDKYIALSKVSGILLQDALNSGETQRIETFLLREFNKKNYIIPCKPEVFETEKRDGKKKDELKGGFVIEPERGLHSNVAVFDFKSMYPTIIDTFNICPSTYLEKDVPGQTIKTPSGAIFYKKEVREGIIPTVLNRLMKERQAVKRKMKDCKDKGMLRTLNAKQWALKIMANAFYGYLGYVRARLYFLEIANAVTGTGRSLIKDCVKKVEKRFGYKIVYGDTDSIMVKISDKDDMDEVAKVAEKIVKSINDELQGSLELEFEKVFKRFLPLTKKRYAAWCFERTKDGWRDKIEMKGIETIRRDWCELVSDTMKNIIEIILKRNDIKEAINYFKDVISKLVKNEIPIQKLAVTKSITKSPDKYDGIQPHIEVVKKMQKRSPAEAPGIGDRVAFVITKGMGLVSKRAEDPLYIIEHKIQVDSNYYIDNQLLPPLERIFASLGISKSELLGNSKQIGLLDIINSHRKEVNQEVVKAAFSDVDGFICEKCSKYYSSIPLSGMCNCGGKVVFSSYHGPVTQLFSTATARVNHKHDSQRAMEQKT